MCISQLPCQGDGQIDCEISQVFIAALIKVLKERQVPGKVRRLFIRMSNGIPMRLIPGSISDDADLVDGNVLRLRPMAVDRNRQPLPATRGLDPVAVTPTTLVILHVVIKDKQIGPPDLVKIASPRNVGRLQNYSIQLSTIS